nr:mevalonate kinase [Acidilobus saccharovorans]
MTRYAKAVAPAKAILFGEHFVVNGSRAIATALGLWTQAIAYEKPSWPIEVESPALGLRCATGPELSCSSREATPLLAVVKALRGADVDVPPARVIISSEAPASAGLGSSASSSAALASALAELAGAGLSKEELYRVVMEGERAAHGNPSGVDPAAVIYGGTIVFRKGAGVVGTISPGLSVPLIVADSGARRSTSAPVLSVIRFLDRIGGLRDSMIGLVEQIIDLASDAIRKGSLEDIGNLMNINHGLLSAIGVSTPELEELVHAARRAGALGAKLTGAGWGGSIIAIAQPEKTNDVVSALSAHSRWVRALEAGAEGARVVEASY